MEDPVNLDELKAKAAAAWQRTFNGGSVSKLAIDATLQLADGETLADKAPRAVRNGQHLVASHEGVVASNKAAVVQTQRTLRTQKSTLNASKGNLKTARVALDHAKNVLGSLGIADVPDEPDND